MEIKLICVWVFIFLSDLNVKCPYFITDYLNLDQNYNFGKMDQYSYNDNLGSAYAYSIFNQVLNEKCIDL